MYLRSVDFLNDQASFDSGFGINLVILRISKQKTGTCAIEDTDYLTKQLTDYCNLCQLHLFCSIFQLQVIGTKTYNIHCILHVIYLYLSGIKLVSKVNGKTISLTPRLLLLLFLLLLLLCILKILVCNSSIGFFR